jgi:anti-sigma regulatory factor (Ser/Thr protein kinase)
MAELVVRAGLDDLDRLYPWFADQASVFGVPPDAAFRIHVALEEAVSNAARHAYDDDGETHTIQVRVRREATRLLAEIEDTGRAFDPTAAPDVAGFTSLEDVHIGGLGIGLMRKFSAGMLYVRRDGRNLLTMIFDLPDQPGSASGQTSAEGSTPSPGPSGTT